jgi:hypothetical protein
MKKKNKNMMYIISSFNKITIFSALSCGEIPLYFSSKGVFVVRLFKKSIILLEGVLA